MSEGVIIAIISGIFGLLTQIVSAQLKKSESSDRDGGRSSTAKSTTRSKVAPFIPFIAGSIITAVIGIIIILPKSEPTPSTPTSEVTETSIGVTALPEETAVPTNVQAPEMFLRIYYEYLNGEDYESAWDMLSDNFKCTHHPPCANPDFENFVSSFDKKYIDISVANVFVQSQADDNSQAELEADITYILVKGKTVVACPNMSFHLVAKPSDASGDGDWQLDKVVIFEDCVEEE